MNLFQPKSKRVLRALSLAFTLVCQLSSTFAETRIEGFSGEGFNQSFGLHLAEIDVAESLSIGFRETELGNRLETNELFLRYVSDRENNSLDSRDRRVVGMNNPESLLRSFHLGLVGIEFNGSKGQPNAVRLTMFQKSRISDSAFATGEFGYQTGTRQNGTNQKNSGGIFSQFGIRKIFQSGFYGAATYTKSPGGSSYGWEPTLSMGIGF